MLEGYEFYVACKTQNFWVDDFGWWGGFFMDLYDYVPTESGLPTIFQQANLAVETEYAYKRMLENCDKEYGGIWNASDVNEPAREKNTVTNAWALRLAASMAYLRPEDPQYLQFANEQYQWLTTGIYNGRKPDNWALYNQNLLIYWTPKGPNNAGPKHVPGNEDALWSGNEGVLLEAFSVYAARFDEGRRQQILRQTDKLIEASVTNSTPNSFVDSQDVCHESPIAADWSNDLATGKGVMLRLLFDFARRHNLLIEPLKNCIYATAQSVWCSQEMKGKSNAQVVRNWNPGFPPAEENDRQTRGLWPLVLQAGGLDALNSAYLLSLL